MDHEKRAHLLSIGEMAEANRVSIATLRLYDRMGLLQPCYRDEESNYRYYDIRQTSRLDIIRYMRNLNMSLAEIHAALERAVLHDEDKIFPDVRYRCESPALGLDGILYKCPSCLAEFRMETDARHIRCTACGFSAELDETYRLHGAPFTHINDWYFWQESLLDLAIPLESETVLAAVGPDGNMDKNAGAGRIYMDRDVIRYTGTCFGKPLAFTEKTEDIKAFPASVAAHFDIYHKKQLYNMHLRPDPRAVIKWVSYLDKLTRERETAAKNAEADNQNG